MQHYLETRGTYDVDAWWSAGANVEERSDTLDRLRQIARDVAAADSLTVSERQRVASEVISIELQRDRKTVFSFQIAERDVELESPFTNESPWAPLALETLADNLGSKMSALVSRGAPRDFQDVRSIVVAEIATVDELWDLWERKNPGIDRNGAKARVARNMSQIALRRPIEAITEEDRPRILAVRAWVADELVRPTNWRSPEPDQEGSNLDRGRDL